MKSWQNIYDEILTKHLRWNSWKFKRVEKRLEKRLDIPIYPKHYFLVIYTHYEEVLTKHFTKKSWQNILRRSLDKTFTKKSWQNIYVHVWQNIYEEEVLTKHLRRSLDKTFTKKKSWQNIYDEIMTKHENIYNLWKAPGRPVYIRTSFILINFKG